MLVREGFLEEVAFGLGLEGRVSSRALNTGSHVAGRD